MADTIEALEAELAAAVTAEQKIDALNALAWVLRDLDQKRGLELAETALHLAQTEQYLKGLATSLVTHSQFTYSDFALALSQGLQALAIFEELDDLAGQSRALYTLCWAHWFADNFVEAVELGRRAQKLAQEIGDRALEADILNNLGLVYKRSGNYDLAYTVYNESLTLYRALGDQLRVSKVLTNIALAYALQGEYDLALASVNESLRLDINDPIINGYTFLALGQVYAGTKQFAEALRYLQQALQIANKRDLEQLSQTALYTMGQIYLERQEPDLAISHLQMALDRAKEIESNLSRFRCHEILSKIYEDQGDLHQALEHYKQFHTIKEAVFNDKNISRLQFLQIHHQAELSRREVEIYQLRNVELEQEIIERKRLQDELFQQATTDVLTGVANRRHFMELAQEEIVHANRLERPLALVLIDLDDFKQINDTYGHEAGDQVLIALAKTCLEHIRDRDIFARLGGDEFVLLLPNAHCEQAEKIVARIRQMLMNQPLDLRNKTISVPISSGITKLSGKQDTLEVLLRRADQALYQAKAAGKNRVSMACS